MKSFEGLAKNSELDPNPEVESLAHREVSFLEEFRGKRRKLASALALMTILSFGKELAAPASANAQESDESYSSEQESAAALFSEISGTYQTFDVEDQETVLRQLQMYENNQDLLGSLSMDKEAEFLHQWVFTRLQDIKNRYGTGNLRVGISLEQGDAMTDALQDDIEVMSDSVYRIRHALELRRVSANGEDWDRTAGVRTEAERVLHGLSAQTPEAVDAKRDFIGRMKEVFSVLESRSDGELKVGFDDVTKEPSEEDLLSPEVHVSIAFERDNVWSNTNYYFHFDPISKKVVGNEGYLSKVFSSEEQSDVRDLFVLLMENE